MTPRRGGVVAVAAVLALTASACTPPGRGEQTIRIGVAADQPGLGLRTGSSYAGFDIDVARYVAQRIGRTPQFVPAPIGQRETLISTGQVDLVIGAFSMTTDRAKRVTFAGPYLVSGQELLVRSGTSWITGPKALRGNTVCAVSRSTSAQRIKDQYPGVQLLELGSTSECVEALWKGTVEAVTADGVILAGYAAQPKYAASLRLAGERFSTERYGIAMGKGDTALCRQVTTALRSMVASGSWKRAVEANLAPTHYRVPTGNPPTPRSCG